MLPERAKFVVCSIISLALSFGMKHLVIGQLQKPAKFSAFHWSTSRSQTFIGQLLGTNMVVHLPKRTVIFLHHALYHGPSMLPEKAKFVVCSIISLALSFWMKNLVIGQFQPILTIPDRMLIHPIGPQRTYS